MTDKIFGLLIGLLFALLLVWAGFEAGVRVGRLTTWNVAMQYVSQGCAWEVEPEERRGM